MGLAQVIVLLLHPFAAMLVIREFMRQREWRIKRIELKDSDRSNALERHEKEGNIILILVVFVILLAFFARITTAFMDGEKLGLATVLPGHFHGWSGLLGLLLMIYLWSLGRKTKSLMSTGEKFTRVKELHGRISDVMMGLILIHAFLGFLYLLKIIG